MSKQAVSNMTLVQGIEILMCSHNMQLRSLGLEHFTLECIRTI